MEASDVRPWPSIETLLVSILPGAVGAHVTAEAWHAFTEPTDVASYELPLILVDRISGADLVPKLDRPILDVDVLASTRGEAQTLAEAVRHYLRWELPGSVFDGVVFTKTRTIVAPRSLPHGNPDIRRYNATYELIMHLTPAA